MMTRSELYWRTRILSERLDALKEELFRLGDGTNEEDVIQLAETAAAHAKMAADTIRRVGISRPALVMALSESIEGRR